MSWSAKIRTMLTKGELSNAVEVYWQDAAGCFKLKSILVSASRDGFSTGCVRGVGIPGWASVQLRLIHKVSWLAGS